jgi:hypothetical protein
MGGRPRRRLAAIRSKPCSTAPQAMTLTPALRRRRLRCGALPSRRKCLSVATIELARACAAKLLGLECESLAKRRQEGKPPLVAQLADLLGRLRTSDDRIEYMNAHALPRGCGPLLVAELVARELDGFARELVDIPRIVRRVRLPAFKHNIHAPYAWPRSSSVDAGSLMFRAICELSSRSA